MVIQLLQANCSTPLRRYSNVASFAYSVGAASWGENQAFVDIKQSNASATNQPTFIHQAQQGLFLLCAYLHFLADWCLT